MKLILALILIQLTYVNNVFASTPLIRLCYEDAEVYPWVTGDEKGLAITQLKIVEKNLGVNFKLIRLPWKRCQLQTKTGQVEGLISASYSKERNEWGAFPMTIDHKINHELRTHTDTFYVYTNKNSTITWDGEAFQKLGDNPVGVQLGYSVGSDVTEQGHKIQSSYSNSYDLLKALSRGIIQVAVLQNYSTIRNLKEHPELSKTIQKNEVPFKVADQFVVFNSLFYKNNPNLCIKIWKSLANARNNPVYVKSQNALLKEFDKSNAPL